MAILFVLLFLLNSSSSMASTLSFSAEVIPWDSPKSPFYNPNATDSLVRSKSEAAVMPLYWGGYLMRLTVGYPPQEMMALMDTGSDITWFQCHPCPHCYRLILPRFEPTNSTTYKSIECSTTTCDKIQRHRCSRDDLCRYEINYADGSFSNGIVSKDQFGLEETKGGNDINLPMIVFGCSDDANGEFDEGGTGMIGLDMGPISFISQFGDFIDWVFSHCLSRYDNHNSSGRIFFGHGATLKGTPTPIIEPKSAPHPFYYVNLVDISVDHQRLNIQPGRFSPRPNGDGGLIMDTGTPMTIIFKDVYDELVLKLIEKITLSVELQDSQNLCYLGKIQELENRKLVPMVTLHFEGGLDVDQQPWNLFYQLDKEHVCLAIRPTLIFDTSIVGAFAQQDMHVGYDLRMKGIRISPANCALL